MKLSRSLLTRYAAALVLASGALVFTNAAPASAVACSSPVRYASSSNTIYLVTAQAFTLTDIKNYCTAAPLTLVDPASKTWELSADLVLQNGSTLTLHGTQSGGDVNTLRLKSLSDNLSTDVVQLESFYGTIDMDYVHVTSWDDNVNGPDTDPSLPSNAGSTDRGRAFVRALSYLDSDGVTPRESYMYINHSELDHLGYYAAESYGVAYKTRGCDHTNLTVCSKVGVYGYEKNSHFHDNFMGTYTWGAKGLVFTYNEYDHDVMYGLDPHDVSINLLIDHNHFHDNGDHGVICSQKCDNLTITNNESDHNGMVPFAGPTGDSDTPGQVHGIMIHRGVTNTTISGNYVHDQPNGAGIAIFDSAGDTVTNNTIVGAEYGIRISVGSANNTVSNNTVTNSSQYGLFLYKGSDIPTYTTLSGHPTGNVFSGNTFNGTGSNAAKYTEADNNTIADSTFSNTGGSILFQSSAGNVLSNVTLPAGQRVSITGSSSEPGSVTVAQPPGPFTLSLDSNSTGDVTSTTGQLFAGAGATSVTPGGSDLSVAPNSSPVVTPQPVTVVPAGGSATASASGIGTGTVHVVVTEAGGVGLTITVSGLTPGGAYSVSRSGAAPMLVYANGSGTVQYSDTPPSGGTWDYAVTG
jgi:parallel beta-helix repeat protein